MNQQQLRQIIKNNHFLINLSMLSFSVASGLPQ